MGTSTETSKKFADRISDLIAEAKAEGADYRSLASELEISPAALSNYASDKQQPNITVLRKVADRFNVSSDWLLGITEDRRRLPTAADELGLTEKAIEILRDLCINEDGYSYRTYNDVLSDMICSEHFDVLVRALPDLSEAVFDVKLQNAAHKKLWDTAKMYPYKEQRKKVEAAEAELSVQFGYKVKLSFPPEQLRMKLDSCVFWATDIIKEVSGFYKIDSDCG